ncbi:MAG TPA: hypothetical protein VL460_04910 [Caulobacteraceae bacterium]|jgi:hypothetical protein|nr:hypothetical protein [Caulobacteraceae bacterium]
MKTAPIALCSHRKTPARPLNAWVSLAETNTIGMLPASPPPRRRGRA